MHGDIPRTESVGIWLNILNLAFAALAIWVVRQVVVYLAAAHKKQSHDVRRRQARGFGIMAGVTTFIALFLLFVWIGAGLPLWLTVGFSSVVGLGVWSSSKD